MNDINTEERARSVLRDCDCVCFDVDSTVIMDEGIDELAAFLGVGPKVVELTNNAMAGSMTYKESLCKRLEIIQPSRQQMDDFITQNPPRLTKGVKELTKLLHARHVTVYLISGGFQAIIEPIAELLNIPKENIFANRITFSETGVYQGFDETCPTCETGGKPKVIHSLKHEHGYKRLVHVGDGVTDMEACPPADAFIGFGGNQVREKVKAGAQWFTSSFQEMIEELENHQLNGSS